MTIHQLPYQTTTFVGRREEINAVADLLSNTDCRLLTLVGSGGIGKTRLAVEVVSQAHLDFPDGIYFVELQTLLPAYSVAQPIAAAVKYEFQGGNNIESELLAFLDGKRLLLVLDNFEHLLPVPDFVTALLDQVADVKLLVTSRERLKLRSEWVYEVHQLSYPSGISVHTLQQYEAVQLFVTHAQRVQHDFSLDAASASVERICRLTEGIPLAIELAAVWVRTLPCSEIADKLQQTLDLLKTNLHDVPSRHGSMRAVFDYSWGLLSDIERQIMLGISVFQGGFRLEAAEQILGVTVADLSSLVDKSLLRVKLSGRYEMYALQRQYVLEQLHELPELKQHLSDKHCTYYLELVSRPELDFDADHFTAIVHKIDADLDNIRVAWDWAIQNQRIDNLVVGMKGLYLYARLRNLYVNSIQAYQSAIDSLCKVEETTSTQLALALSLSLKAMLNIWSGRSQPGRRQNLVESVRILRRLNARPELTIAVGGLGWDLMLAGELTSAEVLLEEAMSLARETENVQFQSFVMWLLGNLASQRGQIAVAERRYIQALEFGRQIRDQRAVVFSLRSLGDSAFTRGSYAQARIYYQDSLNVAKAIDARVISVEIRDKLGRTALATGQLAWAQDYLLETLPLAQQCGKPSVLAVSMTLGDVFLAQSLYADAKKYYEQAHATAIAPGNSAAIAGVQARLGRLALLQRDFASAELHFIASRDYYQKVGDQYAEANTLIDFTRLSIEKDNLSQARDFLLDVFQKLTGANHPPGLLAAIAATAQYYMHQGNLSRAVKLASLVWRHPASHVNVKHRAEQVLTHAEVELFATDLASVSRPDQNADLAQVCAQLIEQLEAQIDQPLVEPLSARELEVLHLVANGQSNREIAQELTLALGTVKSHVHNILQKLDADNRTQAVTRARTLHLL